jgi:uncharacterized protein YoxC
MLNIVSGIVEPLLVVVCFSFFAILFWLIVNKIINKIKFERELSEGDIKQYIKETEQIIHKFNELMIKLDEKLTETHILLNQLDKTVKEITKNSK